MKQILFSIKGARINVLVDYGDNVNDDVIDKDFEKWKSEILEEMDEKSEWSV